MVLLLLAPAVVPVAVLLPSLLPPLGLQGRGSPHLAVSPQLTVPRVASLPTDLPVSAGSAEVPAPPWVLRWDLALNLPHQGV